MSAAFVGDGFPVPFFHGRRKPHNRRQRIFQLGFQLFVVAFDESGALQKILRQIAAGAKLGKYGEFGAAWLGLRRKAQNASRISCEVADGRIELRERYFMPEL